MHLLPAFDIATIQENRADQQTPACDLASYPPDSDQSSRPASMAVAAQDGFNWGYDPLHYTTPEGSYATNPDGTTRTLEFRRMVAGLNGIGLRVVMDVVYNHTAAAGQDDNSILDRVVPGYYQRLSASGTVENSTCCSNTASEHAMMEKLMIDSLITWAKQYKVDGFRFDLMGHHSKQNLLNVRKALDQLTLRKDGVDGKKIFLYGEGWNFGEVADNARFVQATQANMAGTGIATFSDRLRDAVRGGGPFDDDPRIQGFGTGLFNAPNASPENGTPAQQQTRALHYMDLIKVGLTGNLAGFRFVDAAGDEVTGAQVDYNGQPAGYTADPSEVITYVDAHDNETLFDASVLKLPAGHIAGGPGALEHDLAGHHCAVAGSGALACRQRPAAVEVVGPQLLRLRRLVQPHRLDRAAEHPGLRACRRRPTTPPNGRSCSRCSPPARNPPRRAWRRPPQRRRTCSRCGSPRRCSGWLTRN